MHAIHWKESDRPNQQVHQNWFPFDWKMSTFVDLLSPAHISFSRPFSQSLACFSPIPWHWVGEVMVNLQFYCMWKNVIFLIMSAHCASKYKILICYFHQSEFSTYTKILFSICILFWYDMHIAHIEYRYLLILYYCAMCICQSTNTKLVTTIPQRHE